MVNGIRMQFIDYGLVLQPKTNGCPTETDFTLTRVANDAFQDPSPTAVSSKFEINFILRRLVVK